MYDFCLVFPYAALLALGGLAGYLTKGSTASLGGGVGSAVLLSALSYWSLQEYHKGRFCRTATVLCLVISAALTYVMYQRYQRTQKTMPVGLLAAVSALMSAFLLWNVFLFHPNLSRKKA